jgi:hypothetical protein
MDLKRATCHEAGHVVVALCYEFRVDGIEVFEGRFRTMCVLDDPARTDEERFVFLAGGIAGEEFEFPKYDPEGCKDDQAQITKRGGGLIETYLPDATKIIDPNNDCFRALRSKITTKAIEKSMEMMISGGKNSFRLISGVEIQQIWTACQARQRQQDATASKKA